MGLSEVNKKESQERAEISEIVSNMNDSEKRLGGTGFLTNI